MQEFKIASSELQENIHLIQESRLLDQQSDTAYGFNGR